MEGDLTEESVFSLREQNIETNTLDLIRLPYFFKASFICMILKSQFIDNQLLWSNGDKNRNWLKSELNIGQSFAAALE